MRQLAKTAIVIAMAAIFSPASALADGLDRPWKDPEAVKEQRPTGFLNSLFSRKPQTGKPVAAGKPAAVIKPAAPIKSVAPTVAVKPDAGSINIVTKKTGEIIHDAKVGTKPPLQVKTVRKKRVLPVKTVRKKRRLPVKTARKRANKEARWWETVGNRAVFTFRDCSVGYAKGQAANGDVSSPAQLITTAMKTTCQTEFARMAGVLIGGLGEKRSNVMLTELARTTFLPAVTTAMAVGKKAWIVKAAEITDEKKLQAAKAAMFTCFSERADRLTIARNTQANTIADAVLVGCRADSSAFFDLLFANSKASSQVKEQQKNIALNETYKIAIIRRVLASRKPSQVKTAIQQ